MSESPHFKIAQLAADLVDARAVFASLKRKRAACVCENYSKPDPADYYRGDPACYWDLDKDPDCDPEANEWCEPCKRRKEIHPKAVEASKAATKAWYALKRAVNKAKKETP